MIGDRLEMCLISPRNGVGWRPQPKVVVEDLRSFFVGELRHVDDDLTPSRSGRAPGLS